MQVPAEPADHACPFSDEVLAVVDQEADFAFGAVETGDGQIGFSQGGTCVRESVDRVGLAERAGAVPNMGHQLRRRAHDLFARREEVALQSSAHMPEVLDRLEPFLIIMLVRPRQQGEMVVAGRADRLDCDLPANRVRDHGRVGALVRLSPFLLRVGVQDRSVGISQSGAMPRSSQARPAGPSVPAGRTTDISHGRRKTVERTNRHTKIVTLGITVDSGLA